jgi:3-oxoacyl-[acyl-carrier-protein] synthase III
MDIKDIGIVGTGIWEGEPVCNPPLRDSASPRADKVTDPFRGRRGADGVVRIAGMELTVERHPRTVAAIERNFTDPYRCSRRRRLFPRDLDISDAEAEVGRKAMADAGIGPEDVGALLVHSFLPDCINPKNSALVAHKLGIRWAPAWEIESACNSVLAHITVGSMLIQTGFARHVLCIQSAAYSRISDLGTSSSIQEADLATAFVLGPSPGSEISYAWATDGELHDAIRLEWGQPMSSVTRRWWEPSQESLLIRFDEVLQARVMGDFEAHIKRVSDEAMTKAGMGYDELAILIPHQGMSWMRPLMEDILGVREGVGFDTFEEFGNVNSPGIASCLHEARQLNRLKRGTKLLIAAPGAGYTYAAVAMRW